MTALQPNETELVGRWLETEGTVHGDAVCERIEALTHGLLDIVQDHPKHGGWKRLFCDKQDGRFWERSYPQSDLHGKGPPVLRWISDDEAAREYGLRL